MGLYKEGNRRASSLHLRLGSEKTVLPLPMGRNCNLDLCLVPAGASSSLGTSDSGRAKSEESTGSPQQLTIFYNGRVCNFYATESQARAILALAKREMEENCSSEPLSRQPIDRSLSMKRSLQQFLQKRKSRIQGGSPYEQ